MLLKVGITTSQLIGEMSPALRHHLKASLSYEDQGQVMARRMAFKRYGKVSNKMKWSGKIYLINDKFEFPSGLVERVRQLLKQHNHSFIEVQDYTVPEPTPVALTAPVDLWDHQLKAIEQIKFNRNGIIQIGTGGGKTITSIVGTAEVGQLPVLFVVNRVKLMTQAHGHFAKMLGEPVGMVGNGQMTFGRFTIATIHTICSVLNIKHKQDVDEEEENTTYTPQQINMLKVLLKATRCVVVDECHHASSDMYTKLFKHIPNAVYRVGLSATPYRTDGTELLLEAAFGNVIYAISASELILLGKLTKPIITFCAYDDPLSLQYPVEVQGRKAAFQTVYQKCIVENDVYNTVVAKVAIANAKMNRLTLVSVTRVVHGDNILKKILEIDPCAKVQFLNGENKKKLGEEKVIKEFTGRKTLILISTLMDEGVDIPAIEVAIDAGGGQSPTKALQLTGRAMRLFEGKACCYIYMFIHQYTYLFNHSVNRLKILQTEPEFEIRTLQI